MSAKPAHQAVHFGRTSDGIRPPTNIATVQIIALIERCVMPEIPNEPIGQPSEMLETRAERELERGGGRGERLAYREPTPIMKPPTSAKRGFTSSLPSPYVSAKLVEIIAPR